MEHGGLCTGLHNGQASLTDDRIYQQARLTGPDVRKIANAYHTAGFHEYINVHDDTKDIPGRGKVALK